MKKELPQVEVVYDSNDQVLISDDGTLVWGIGDTFLEAIEDYAISVLEWFILVRKDKEKEKLEDLLDANEATRLWVEYKNNPEDVISWEELKEEIENGD